MAPEHDPASDHQPTREEWEAYERERSMFDLTVPSGATISECKRYRYTLWR